MGKLRKSPRKTLFFPNKGRPPMLPLWALLALGVARPDSSRAVAPDPKSPLVEAALKRLAAKTAARRRLVA